MRKIKLYDEDKVDKPLARELYLVSENNEKIYETRIKPIIRNYVRKKLRGVYNDEKAVKGYIYAIEDARKELIKNELLPKGIRINKDTKMYASEQLKDSFEEEVNDLYKELKKKQKKQKK